MAMLFRVQFRLLVAFILDLYFLCNGLLHRLTFVNQSLDLSQSIARPRSSERMTYVNR